MKTEELQQTVLQSLEASELYSVLITITKEKSALIKKRSEQKGLVDDIHINSDLALLNTLEDIARAKIEEFKGSKGQTRNYKFRMMAKEKLPKELFNEIERAIR